MGTAVVDLEQKWWSQKKPRLQGSMARTQLVQIQQVEDPKTLQVKERWAEKLDHFRMVDQRNQNHLR
jgi:hypothetical protein